MHSNIHSPRLACTEIAISRSRCDLGKIGKIGKILIFQGFRTGDFPHKKGLRIWGNKIPPMGSLHTRSGENPMGNFGVYVRRSWRDTAVFDIILRPYGSPRPPIFMKLCGTLGDHFLH